MSDERHMKFTKLCLSGGGIKGFCQLGALEFCKEKGLLNDIHTYSGTSIGSAISTLLCIGYKPSQIYGQFLRTSFLPQTKDIDFYNLLTKFGLLDSDMFADSLSILIRKKLNDTVPNMKQLYEMTGKDLYIAASNTDETDVVFFHHSTHPELDIVEAVKMSCNIPFIFTRIKYNDQDYSDGGLCAHTPFSIIDDGNEPILNIVTCGFDTNINTSSFGAMGKMVDYFLKVLMLPVKFLEKLQRQLATDMCYFISIKADDIMNLSTYLAEEGKEKLWFRGYQTAQEWYVVENMDEFDSWGWDIPHTDF